MAHFAQVVDGIVQQVIVADQDFINSGFVGEPSAWVQTSYNTFGGLHYGADGQPDGGEALRKNYAAVGFTYDAERDAFIPPKQYPSWVLNEDTCHWEAPVASPQDGGTYVWDEDTTAWVATNEMCFLDVSAAPPQDGKLYNWYDPTRVWVLDVTN